MNESVHVTGMGLNPTDLTSFHLELIERAAVLVGENGIWPDPVPEKESLESAAAHKASIGIGTGVIGRTKKSRRDSRRLHSCLSMPGHDGCPGIIILLSLGGSAYFLFITVGVFCQHWTEAKVFLSKLFHNGFISF